MYPRLFILACSAASALAASACGNGIFKSPVMTSFVTVNVQAGLPNNVTTPDGIVATAPILNGNITGQFIGELIPNLSFETERFLPYHNGEFTVVESLWIFKNSNNETILARLDGTTTYANNAFHGLGNAKLSTDIKELYWVNSARFLIEWEGEFFTGKAVFEFFQITTGGRKDGKPVQALQPPNSA